MLGVCVDALTVETLFRAIEDAIGYGEPTVIANHNLHSIYLYHRDPKMRAFYARAAYTFIDGMALILAGRVAGHPLRRSQRMTSIDWLRPLLVNAEERGWSVFLLGGREGVAEQSASIFQREFPRLRIGSHHGYFDARPESNEARDVIAVINAFRPDILCVGMGMPRQEHWIVDHVDRLDARVILNLGGFMDLLTGKIPTPPRWMARVGLEWLGRLASRPQDVWRRYLWEPWFLLPRLAQDVRQRIASSRSARGIE